MAELQTEIRGELADLKIGLRAEMTEMTADLGIKIKQEGWRTKKVAEVNAHHAVVVDDHEMRIKSIEKRV